MMRYAKYLMKELRKKEVDKMNEKLSFRYALIVFGIWGAWILTLIYLIYKLFVWIIK